MRNIRDRTFSEKIKMRIRVLWGILVLLLIYMIVIGEMGLGDRRIMTSLAESVSNIIFFGGLIYVIKGIIHNKKLLKSRNLLVSQSMKELDERNQYLYDKSGGVVVDTLLLFLLITTCTAGFIDMTAFNLSLTILTLTVILKVGSYTYYNKTL